MLARAREMKESLLVGKLLLALTPPLLFRFSTEI